MMISYDDIDSSGLEAGNRPNGARAAVTGHDERSSRLSRGANTRIGQIVAVLESSWNERYGVPTGGDECTDHNRRRTDPVDVVVAVDEDRFIVAQRPYESTDGTIEVRQAVWLVELIKPWTQECLRVFGRRETATCQQARDGRGHMQLSLQPLDNGSIRLGRKQPACLWPSTNRSDSHHGKLFIAVPANNHHSAAYNMTPHPSHNSVAPVPDMILRRCKGSIVSQ